MTSRLIAFFALVGCTPTTSTPPLIEASVDASIETGVDADVPDVVEAGPPCDPTSAWTTPIAVAGLDSTLIASPSFSADERTVIYQFDTGANADLLRATRPTTNGPFGVGVPVNGFSAPSFSERTPSLSADGLAMYLALYNGSYEDIQVAMRPTLAADFGAATAVAGVNSPWNDYAPFVSADGSELWFVSMRKVTPQSPGDIFVAKTNGNGFDAPVEVAELNTSSLESYPRLTPDGLQIFFGTDRVPPALTDVWTATRPTKSSPWSPPKAVSELNGAGTGSDEPAWISPDGCRIYIVRANPSGSGVFMARRSK